MSDSDLEAARAVAFRFLALSARSRAEIVRRLERSAFAPEVIAAVVDELAAKGYLDDARFARHWVADRADRKRYGRSRLAAELRRKGVDRELVSEAIDEVDEEDELRRALAAARPRLSADLAAAAAGESRLVAMRRLSEFLQRRGFRWHTIRQVLAMLMPNED